MGWLALLWTYLKGPVVVGNGTSLAFHYAMQFHAFSSIEAVEKYTDDCYRVSTYKACYEPLIDPINSQNMWTSTGLSPMHPPIKRRPPGRPKKKRAR